MFTALVVVAQMQDARLHSGGGRPHGGVVLVGEPVESAAGEARDTELRAYSGKLRNHAGCYPAILLTPVGA
ncbi:hypothetical protein [Streptomyces sp. SID3343]|uniref:hypothetical protein n=1 Tax=Streptomyces sp. SID3343 TaxID=2690260 RepID=UPI00136A1C69|nr:hypothetical protein [Streptomyces sp. SID3343]MYW01123.1 hypothetical protein [Streptomyces sp. SID3343]